jgi:V/A-type H+/Na+-transporting ATPase subunit C
MAFKWGSKRGWLRRGRGNYPYAVARVKSKKSLLLTKDNYPKLLMMDLNEIARFLGETQYKVEMAELASRYDGVNLIELGTAMNQARVYSQILGFCTGDLKTTLEKYLARWDYMNVKTLLRAKLANVTTEELQEDIVAAGKLTNDDIMALFSLDSVKDILDVICRKYGIDVPDEIASALETSNDLGPVEDYLDKLYYQRFFEQLDHPTRPEKILVNWMRIEVDMRNIITLLKLKRYKVHTDHPDSYFIDGGAELSVKELVRIMTTESLEAAIVELGKLSYYEQIKDALEAAKQTGSLSEVEITLHKRLARQSEKLSRVYPSSVLPIVDYIVRKKIEVDNIRIIARCKQSGLNPDQIKKLLVI